MNLITFVLGNFRFLISATAQPKPIHTGNKRSSWFLIYNYPLKTFWNHRVIFQQLLLRRWMFPQISASCLPSSVSVSLLGAARRYASPSAGVERCWSACLCYLSISCHQRRTGGGHFLTIARKRCPSRSNRSINSPASHLALSSNSPDRSPLHFSCLVYPPTIISLLHNW